MIVITLNAFFESISMPKDTERGRVVIAGGRGFLGTSLATHLTNKGWSVVVLSRRLPRRHHSWLHAGWDARTFGEWSRALEGAWGLVNRAGRSVDCIKTPDHQDEILRSRTEATRALGLAVRSLEAPPQVWVQMSTAHIYGDPPHVTCTEDSPFGHGFAPFVGRAWEWEFKQSVLPTQRGVLFRTRFVIGRDRGAGGGALARLRTLVRVGLGGTVGSGTQGRTPQKPRRSEGAWRADRVSSTFLNGLHSEGLSWSLRRMGALQDGLCQLSRNSPVLDAT
jgi:NAD dependent epimerase/dehydratase family enzyme